MRELEKPLIVVYESNLNGSYDYTASAWFLVSVVLITQ